MIETEKELFGKPIEFKVDNSIYLSLENDIKDLSGCIKEFVDNALDANAKEIDVNLEGKKLIVTDDGDGMSVESVINDFALGGKSKNRYNNANLAFAGVGAKLASRASAGTSREEIELVTKKNGYTPVKLTYNVESDGSFSCGAPLEYDFSRDTSWKVDENNNPIHGTRLTIPRDTLTSLSEIDGIEKSLEETYCVAMLGQNDYINYLLDRGPYPEKQGVKLNVNTKSLIPRDWLYAKLIKEQKPEFFRAKEVTYTLGPHKYGTAVVVTTYVNGGQILSPHPLDLMAKNVLSSSDRGGIVPVINGRGLGICEYNQNLGSKKYDRNGFRTMIIMDGLGCELLRVNCVKGVFNYPLCKIKGAECITDTIREQISEITKIKEAYKTKQKLGSKPKTIIGDFGLDREMFKIKDFTDEKSDLVVDYRVEDGKIQFLYNEKYKNFLKREGMPITSLALDFLANNGQQGLIDDFVEKINQSTRLKEKQRYKDYD